MKKTFALLSFCIVSLILLSSCGDKPQQAATIAIIPNPVSMQVCEEGAFQLDRSTKIYYAPGDSVQDRFAQVLSQTLGRILGIDSLEMSPPQVGQSSKNTISLAKSVGHMVKPESYVLSISTDEISIGANDYNGYFYSLQTILQLLPPEVYGDQAVAKAYLLPALEITDYPRFGYRGMHLDVVRHFFDVDFVKRYIDLIAMHKLNAFHWHLTDDQGWRIEIKKYHLLTEKSAWRVDRRSDGWNTNRPPEPGEEATYGGFYTQEQIRDVVAYAKDRGITVIPEVDMPGHSTAVFASYPHLSCLGKEQFVTPGGYYPPDMATCFCAGNEDVYTFLQDVLDEVIDLFPDAPYIHIGGDEVDKQFWSNCPTCQAKMKAEGLKNVDELQSYFMKRMEAYVNSKGKPIIGWDEILQGGLAPNATVMSWRGEQGGIEAAKLGHDVIMATDKYLYFDHFQNDPQVEPRAMSGLTTVKKVYSYEPIPADLTPEESKHVLGAQATMWNEQVQTPEHVEYMVLPRMSALAEVVWSPSDSRDYDNFMERLEVQEQRYAAMGMNYHPGADMISFDVSYDSVSKTFNVGIRTELHKGEVYYTIDGTEPTVESPKYTSPIPIRDLTMVRAIAARAGKRISKEVVEQVVGMHKAFGKKVTYNNPLSRAYTGTLTTLVDGLTGTGSHNDGFYQGLNRKDFDVVIDLGESMHLHGVVGSFLQSIGSWVYLPSEMIVAVSNDGENYKVAGRSSHDFNANQHPVIRHRFVVTGHFDARYIRVVGVNGVTPSGLSGAGNKNHLFADEIFVF